MHQSHAAAVAKEVGGTIVFKGYTRFEKGEGIEKKQENFADEIASMWGRQMLIMPVFPPSFTFIVTSATGSLTSTICANWLLVSMRSRWERILITFAHALAILGLDNIRKYVTLLTIQQLTKEKPEELFRISLVRGHFLESLAPLAGMGKARNSLFMLGLFSLMDVIVGIPMEEVVELTQLSESISSPLLAALRALSFSCTISKSCLNSKELFRERTLTSSSVTRSGRRRENAVFF